MEHLSSDMEQQVESRIDKVQELCSKGYSQRDIPNIAIGLASVNRDISHLKSLQGTDHETNYEDVNSGKLNENIAPLPSLLFSAHILPP